MQLQAVRGRDIEKTADTDDCIDEKSAKRDLGPIRLTLQQVMHDGQRQGEMIDQVAKYHLDRARRQIAVDHRRRADQNGIDRVVEGENLSVQRLQRVVDLTRWRRGASA